MKPKSNLGNKGRNQIELIYIVIEIIPNVTWMIKKLSLVRDCYQKYFSSILTAVCDGLSHLSQIAFKSQRTRI